MFILHKKIVTTKKNKLTDVMYEKQKTYLLVLKPIEGNAKRALKSARGAQSMESQAGTVHRMLQLGLAMLASQYLL